MFPAEMLKQVLIAGVLLAIMSVIDTLSYGVRTAGVRTKRLAISLSLFNILVIFSRISNMFSAPVLGNFPDKVYRGAFTSSDVLNGLRADVLFIIAGVLVGGMITPTVIRVFDRGIQVLDAKGSILPTVAHGIKHIYRLPAYCVAPIHRHITDNIRLSGVPYGFLLFNVFVTCFYSIGVMSTVYAASLNHSVAGTAIMLSGIVNGIATLLLFLVVDPPAAVVIDGCINGKRPIQQAYAMNLYLVATRLAGTILALALIAPMGHYVLHAAKWVDSALGSERTRTLLQTSSDYYEYAINQTLKSVDNDKLEFSLVIVPRENKELSHKSSPESVSFELVVSSGESYSFNATKAKPLFLTGDLTALPIEYLASRQPSIPDKFIGEEVELITTLHFPDHVASLKNRFVWTPGNYE